MIRADLHSHTHFSRDGWISPERYVRPREEVFNPAWTPPRGDQTALGLDLVERYDIERVDDCSICHR